jgi:cell division protein YceG involved in septum cleavage
LFKGNRSQLKGERTAEERARARAERERRRAGTAGGAVSAAREEHSDSGAPDDVSPRVEAEPVGDSPSIGMGVEGPVGGLSGLGVPVEGPVGDLSGLGVPVEEPVEDLPDVGVAAEESLEGPREIEPAIAALGDEPPSPRYRPAVALPVPPVSRRDSRMRRRVDALREQRGSAGGGSGRRVRLRLTALVALIAAIAAVWLLAQPLRGSKHRPVVAVPSVVKMVIPEGETRLQIAAIAKVRGLKGSYLAASKRSPLLRPTDYGAPSNTPNLEGFLFPATYEVFAGASMKRLVEEQLAAFHENFGRQETQRAHALHITPYQLLTVASMIEREAEVERDRPLIAAVIYNRLRLGMTLGIDATIRYALNDYSQPLTETQLQSPSAYNTRLHTGLPPTPIGNPGVASIQAAAHPAHVSYLYYVAAADGCGKQVFSSSYAQFEKDAAAYREAVARNHGRVPTCRVK